MKRMLVALVIVVVTEGAAVAEPEVTQEVARPTHNVNFNVAGLIYGSWNPELELKLTQHVGFYTGPVFVRASGFKLGEADYAVTALGWGFGARWYPWKDGFYVAGEVGPGWMWATEANTGAALNGLSAEVGVMVGYNLTFQLFHQWLYLGTGLGPGVGLNAPSTGLPIFLPRPVARLCLGYAW